jgi:hypothetical protein
MSSGPVQRDSVPKREQCAEEGHRPAGEFPRGIRKLAVEIMR